MRILTSETLAHSPTPTWTQAAVFDYTRLPHPDLWLPLLIRARMAGFNGVWVPFPWAFHSPAAGFHDFTGPRDLRRLLQEIQQAGLWLIAAIGPWLGEALGAGGLPAWWGPGEAAAPGGALRALGEWWDHLLPLLRGCDTLKAVVIDPGQPAGGSPLFAAASELCAWVARFDLAVPCLAACAHPVPEAGGSAVWPELARLLDGGVTSYALDPWHGGVAWGQGRPPDAGIGHGAGGPLPCGAPGAAYYQTRQRVMAWETAAARVAGAQRELPVRVSPPASQLALRASEAGGVVCLGAAEDELDAPTLSVRWGEREVETDPIALAAGDVRLLPVDWPLAGGALRLASLEVLLRVTVAGRELLVLANELGGDLWLSADFRHEHSRGPVEVTREPPGLRLHFEPAPLASVVLRGPEHAVQFLALEPGLASRVWPLDESWRTMPVHAPSWEPRADAPARGLVIGPDLVRPREGRGYDYLVRQRGRGYRWGPWRGSDPHTWLTPLVWYPTPTLRAPDLAWTSRPGAPEALADYDDRSWRAVAPNEPLALEAHGLSEGFAWYRGRFVGAATRVTLACWHAADVFLNGVHIGVLNPPPEGHGAASTTLPLPERALRPHNVLAVLVEHRGREPAAEALVRPHGLLHCALDSGAALEWRLRRGLTGERLVQGFAGYADWALTPLEGSGHVSWHRAAFELDLAADIDAAISLVLERIPVRAYIYLNGTLIGRYQEGRDTQRELWLPEGLLRRQGRNELLIAQWTRGATPGIGRAQLAIAQLGQWIHEAD